MKLGIEPTVCHRLTEHSRKTACAVPDVPAGFNPLRFQRIDERVIARCVPERKNGEIIFYLIDFTYFPLVSDALLMRARCKLYFSRKIIYGYKIILKHILKYL